MKPKQRQYILDNQDKLTIEQMAKHLNLKERNIRKFLNHQNITPIEPKKAEPQANPLTIRKGKTFWLSMLLIAVLGLVSYFNTFEYEFVWDDVNLVQTNPVVQKWSNLPEVLTDNLGVGVIQLKSSSFRPLQTITYMMDYSFWKYNPKGYHITNVILHIMVALCIFVVIIALFDDQILALFTAMLFVVHPIHTEAVTYISGRADPLSAIFILIGFYFYVKHSREHKISSMIGVILTFIAAVFSRESALIILPGAILVYSFSLRKKVDWTIVGTIAGLIVLYYVLRKMEILGAIRQLGTNPPTFTERVPGFFVALKEYVRLIPFPFQLHMEYQRPIFKMSNPRALIGIVFLVALVFGILKTRKKFPLICFGLTWFLVGILPVSNVFVVVNAFMAEHWLYLPSIGIFLIASAGLCWLMKNQQLRPVALIIITGLTAFYSYLTIQQNKVWAEPISFYEYTMKFAPDSSRLRADLGVAYYNAGRKEDAINSFKTAIKMNPHYAFAYNNLGAVFNSMGKFQEAVEPLKRAVAYQDNYAVAYYNMGNAYKSLNKYKEAADAYENAVKIDPRYADAMNNLAIIKARLGERDEAIKYYQKGLELSPNNIRIYNNLGSVYSDMGKFDEARKLFERALRIGARDKDLAIIYNNLGLTYNRLGRNDEAIVAWQKSIEFNKESWQSYQRLIELLQKLGRKQEAEAVFKQMQVVKGKK
jgi:tetratricopeptide (TPR) repeat protein